MALPIPTRTKVASQFYQFAYENRGFISIHKSHRPEEGWKLCVREYRGWDKSNGHFLRIDDYGYKTMKEALHQGSHVLMTDEERAERWAIEKAEIDANIERVSKIIAANQVIFDRAKARGITLDR